MILRKERDGARLQYERLPARYRGAHASGEHDNHGIRRLRRAAAMREDVARVVADVEEGYAADFGYIGVGRFVVVSWKQTVAFLQESSAKDFIRGIFCDLLVAFLSMAAVSRRFLCGLWSVPLGAT